MDILEFQNEDLNQHNIFSPSNAGRRLGMFEGEMLDLALGKVYEEERTPLTSSLRVGHNFAWRVPEEVEVEDFENIVVVDWIDRKYAKQFEEERKKLAKEVKKKGLEVTPSGASAIYSPLDANYLLPHFLECFTDKSFGLDTGNPSTMNPSQVNQWIKAWTRVHGLLLVNKLDSISGMKGIGSIVSKDYPERSRSLFISANLQIANYKVGSVKQFIEYWKLVTTIKFLWDFKESGDNKSKAIELLNIALEEIPTRVTEDGRTGRLIPSLRGAITYQLYEYMFGVTYIKLCPYSKCGKSYMTESKKQSGCSAKHSNNYRQEKRRARHLKDYYGK